MSIAPPDPKRLCVHTITTKPWSLTEAIEAYTQANIGHITVWANAYDQIGPERAGAYLRDSGLSVTSLCRGGFFPAATEAGRSEAIDQNRRLMEEAATLGAPMVVLVCGAVPGIPLGDQRAMIRDGIEALLPQASQLRVKLAIEPLHPMYAGDRSAINTMAQANDVAEAVGSEWVGVAVDVYHLWWDPDLEAEIARCGEAGRLFAFHVCDWRSPTRDMLNDRALMGDGCVPIRQIREWVERGGFNGAIEVEIFSDEWWAKDQHEFLAAIRQRCEDYC